MHGVDPRECHRLATGGNSVRAWNTTQMGGLMTMNQTIYDDVKFWLPIIAVKPS
jgi:hypothetical protein